MINMKTANLHIYLISHNNYINRRNDLAINLVHTYITHEAIRNVTYTSSQQELENEAQALHEPCYPKYTSDGAWRPTRLCAVLTGGALPTTEGAHLWGSPIITPSQGVSSAATGGYAIIPPSISEGFTLNPTMRLGHSCLVYPHI